MAVWLAGRREMWYESEDVERINNGELIPESMKI